MEDEKNRLVEKTKSLKNTIQQIKKLETELEDKQRKKEEAVKTENYVAALNYKTEIQRLTQQLDSLHC